jgi:DivIVA domain-containing protein
MAPPAATNVSDMDLKLDRLREVEFHQKLNGYNPREVDEFVEQVALAVEELLGSLHTLEATGNQLTARLHELEAAAPGGSWATAMEIAAATTPRVDLERDSAFDQETIARVLLLAQRTAEGVISEAEKSAHILREEAQASAERIVQQAEIQAASVTEDARSAADATLAGLERERLSLETTLAALRSRAIQHREGLREMLSDQLLTLDGWLTANTDPHLGQDSLGPVPDLRPYAGLEVGGDADEPTLDLTLADLQAADVNPRALPPPLTT